ncbi:hypothetical protein ANN_03367 [Periplaneta americana]|uniref:Uncharacterized protein n=1 Tax=Periplaneta americana TaxID=6978 RepID=A0ABQ8TYT9_PERAM|nr:hypothetical protein ANN_03367 [Periplaneta americana]
MDCAHSTTRNPPPTRHRYSTTAGTHGSVSVIESGEEYKACRSVLCNFLHSPVTSSLLDPNIFLRTLFSNTLNLCSSLKVRVQVSQPNRKQRMSPIPRLIVWIRNKRRIPNLTGPVDNNDVTLKRIRNKTAGRIDGCHGDYISCLCYASKILRNFRTAISFKEKRA